MKLRIKGNSIRLRLTMSEVATLAAGMSLSEKTSFGPAQALRYAIRGSQKNHLMATFDGSAILIDVPQEDLDRWAASDDVAISSSQAIEDLKELQILIEKDFECLHPASQSEPDAFPNPQSTRTRSHAIR